MTSDEFMMLSLQLSAMLMCSIAAGETMRAFRQPAVVGELLVGVALGPTLLGAVSPQIYEWLFLNSSNVTVGREACTNLGMLLFLFYTGLQVKIPEVSTFRRTAAVIGIVATVVPLIAGPVVVYAMPSHFWGASTHDLFPLGIFIGMNFANSANPVIARILLDLRLADSHTGAVVMSATLVDDAVNWLLFALVLNGAALPVHNKTPVPYTLAIGVALLGVVMCSRHWLAPCLGALTTLRRQRPSGMVAFTVMLVLLVSSGAEALGIHPFLAAFLLGLASGQTNHEWKDAHEVIGQFVLGFFAPLYFVSIGMSTHFVTHFDLPLVSTLLLVGVVTKIGAVLLAMKLTGRKTDREAWAIAFALNARGATGIVLAGLGRATGLIDDRLFVAIVLMAIVTSVVAGPAIAYLIKPVDMPRSSENHYDYSAD